LDPYTVLKNTTADFRFNYNVWKIETTERMRRKKEKETGLSAGTIILMDMTGLGWAHMSPTAMAYFQEGTTTNKLNYPETLRRSFLVNVPSFFSIIWDMITPLIDPSTIDKTTIRTSNYLNELLEVASIDVIPSELGGQGPPLGSGGEYIPFDTVTEAIIQEIPAGCSFEKELKINEPGKLEWEWKIETHDIGFAIYRLDQLGEHKEVFKYSRLFSNSGTLEVEQATYKLLWDNKYSWTKKKVLHYHLSVDTPIIKAD